MKFALIFFAASAAIFLIYHKGTQIFGKQSLHGANFLFQITDYSDYPDIFLSTVHIKNSWLSVQFVGINKAYKWTLSKLISRPRRTRICTNLFHHQLNLD